MKLKLLFYLLVIVHHISVLLLLVSPTLLIVYEPFWVWLPVNVWIMHVIFSPVLVCPATIWENRLRRKLDKPVIKTFILHYYIKPIKRIRDYFKYFFVYW